MNIVLIEDYDIQFYFYNNDNKCYSSLIIIKNYFISINVHFLICLHIKLKVVAIYNLKYFRINNHFEKKNILLFSIYS